MKLKLIGLYQLITGIFGVILLVFSMAKVIRNTEILFTYFLGLLMFAAVAYAGYAMLNNLKNAVKYSIWAQAFQIISFTYGNAVYLFTGSAFLGIVIGDGVHIKSQIQPIDYTIAGNIASSPLEITIFIVPVILVFLLAKK